MNSSRESLPSRILIVGLRLTEDVLFGLPLVNALRERYPSARIAWATSLQGAALLEGHSAKLEIIDAESVEGWHPLRRWAVAREVRRFAPCVAFDLTQSAGSSWLAKVSNARCRIGAAEGGSRTARRRLTDPMPVPASHLADARLQLAAGVGADASDGVRFGLPENAEAEIAVDALLRRLGIEGDFMLVAGLGGAPSRMPWAVERCAAVVRYLGRERGVPSVMLAASKQDVTYAETVQRASRGHAAVAFAESTPHVLALVRRASVYLGADTPLLHAAAAVGTPCVGVHGPRREQSHVPYGQGHQVLRSLDDRFESISHAAVCAACEEAYLRSANEETIIRLPLLKRCA